MNVPYPLNQEMLEAGITSCLRTIASAQTGKEEAVFTEQVGYAIRYAYKARWEKTDIVDRLDNAGAAIGLDATIRQRILTDGIMRVEGAETAGEIPASMQHIDAAVPPEIKCADPWWRDPATIPSRAFLYDRHYSRRNIGATIAAGGRAKTTLSVYEALSMTAGRDLSTQVELSSGPLRVWLLNGEEDQDELDRRIAATCQHYGLFQEDLGGRLFAQSVRDKPLRIAKLANNAPTVDESVKAFMIGFILQNRIDVFMVDPLTSFHAVGESSNEHTDVVIKQGFGAIAGKTDSAGELFHHPGKPRPGQAETTVESSKICPTATKSRSPVAGPPQTPSRASPQPTWNWRENWRQLANTEQTAARPIGSVTLSPRAFRSTLRTRATTIRRMWPGSALSSKPGSRTWCSTSSSVKTPTARPANSWSPERSSRPPPNSSLPKMKSPSNELANNWLRIDIAASERYLALRPNAEAAQSRGYAQRYRDHAGKGAAQAQLALLQFNWPILSG